MLIHPPLNYLEGDFLVKRLKYQNARNTEKSEIEHIHENTDFTENKMVHIPYICGKNQPTFIYPPAFFSKNRNHPFYKA